MRFLLPVLILLGSCSRPQVSPEELYRSAKDNLRRGELQRAAEESHRGALRWRKQPGSEWRWRFRLLEAEVLLAQGKAPEALSLLDTAAPPQPQFAALEARRKVDRGNALLKLGRPGEARALLVEAGRCAAAAAAPEVVLEAEVLQGLALSAEGRMDAAEAVLRGALERAVRQRDPYYEAATLNNLGFNRLRTFRYDAAIPFLERARDASEKAGAQRFTAVILGNLAVCHYRLGDFEKALAYREKAIGIQQRADALLDLQASLGEIGNIYLLEGDAMNAALHYRRALELARKLNALSDASKWAGNLASALAETRQWDSAEKLNQEALELKRQINDVRSQVYSTLNAAMIAAGRKQYTTATALYEQTIQSAKDNPALLWEAEAGLASLHAARGESRTANRHFESAIGIIEKTRAGLLRFDYKITFLSRLIRFYQEYVDALVSQGASERALQVADSSRARILLERMGLGHGDASRIGLKDLENAARASNTVVLSYWLAPRRSFLWVIGAQGIRFFTLPPEGEIAPLVKAYRAAIENLRDPLAMEHPAGRRLYEMLVGPAEPLIPDQAKVVIVPDGALAALNFETLPVYRGRPHYWIEDVTVLVAPSLRILRAGDAARELRPGGLLLIGDPVAVDPAFPKLAHVPGEISRVAQHFPQRAVLTGPQATPAAYRDAHPERFSVIHFAAHADANRESPLDSAVILSPDGDGFKLYARDIVNHRLRAGLVTISACRGAGARAFSGEGLVGFAWAFLQAGARHVIAGLWDVNDDSTARMMEKLYSEIESGEAPGAALRASKLALVGSPGNYHKPYYWAPFQTYIRCWPAGASGPGSIRIAARSRASIRSSGMPVSTARSATDLPPRQR